MALPLSYNWKNLLARRGTTAMTVLVVAAVVAVFTWMSGFGQALSNSLSFAQDQHKLIVLKQGATSETNSAIPTDEYNKLTQLDAVARDEKTGQPLKSPEMIVQVSLPRIADRGKTSANVAVRGVRPEAFSVHRNVRLMGRMFESNGLEVIVGRAAAKQFAGLEVGATLNLGYSGNRAYRIVGHFTADGGPMESEIWGPLDSLLNSYNRSMYSSVSLRLGEAAEPDAVIKRIEGPAIGLTALSEPQYWDSQAGNIRTYLTVVTVLVAVMSVAAVIAIAITMFSSVAGRVREFAMLRTIGFSGRQILTAVLIESVLLALIGGVIGCAACAAWLWLAGNTKDMFGATNFTTLAFEIHFSPLIALYAVGLVCLVAAIGAIFPALRAGRLSVVQALREA